MRPLDASASFGSVQGTILKSRKLALKSMWTIIIIMTFCALYDLTYSLMLFFLSSDECTP